MSVWMVGSIDLKLSNSSSGTPLSGNPMVVAGVAVEPRSGESAVPRPVVLGVSGGMDPDVAAASLDEPLEIVLLCGIEHIAGGVEKHDSAISGEVLGAERGGVLGGVDGEPIFLSELSDCSEADSDRAVSVPSGIGGEEAG